MGSGVEGKWRFHRRGHVLAIRHQALSGVMAKDFFKVSIKMRPSTSSGRDRRFVEYRRLILGETSDDALGAVCIHTAFSHADAVTEGGVHLAASPKPELQDEELPVLGEASGSSCSDTPSLPSEGFLRGTLTVYIAQRRSPSPSVLVFTHCSCIIGNEILHLVTKKTTKGIKYPVS